MNFLKRIINQLLEENSDLSGVSIVLPGKRPVVFIKRILEEKQYSGFLPHFFTIEELIIQIAEKQEIKGVSLWLFAYDTYKSLGLQSQEEDFAGFLKWFPTISKDWDDMMKFSDDEIPILEVMQDEERIKNWAQKLENDERKASRKYLNFWKNMFQFLPVLKQRLEEKNWATSGMIHQVAKNKIPFFAQNTDQKFVFCGFNAFTPIEENLVKSLLQWDNAQCFFHTDEYYVGDEKQEAGRFIREHQKWKEFNDSRNFAWVENEFSKPKNINVYEVSGSISQTKLLPEIIESHQDHSETAVVLMDENLLPAALDSLQMVENLNITMGFPLKNLSFSIAIRHLFHLQKQLLKKSSSYYYSDITAILEEIPKTEEEEKKVGEFLSKIEQHNMVYLSPKILEEYLSGLSVYPLLLKNENSFDFLDLLSKYCFQLKFHDLDDVTFENISHFEKVFKLITNQIQPYSFSINTETLEQLIQQYINTETIDFQGEPLQGLQVMGLLETRLLNFKNIILLSVNEGKLPLGNSQNTFLPFDIRKTFGLHTYLENDGIYAYHFYRLLQDAGNVHLLYNGVGSGMSTGEKSRFITQLELESPHEISHTIIENTSEPVSEKLMEIGKTEVVQKKLLEWKNRVSATHLTSYLYDPIQFYFNKILNTDDSTEIEEELSNKNFGNLVHYSLQAIYENFIGKYLSINDLETILEEVDKYLDESIEKLKHQPEYYKTGMNFIQKSIAKRVIESVINYDLDVLKNGNQLKIIAIEKKFEDVVYYLDDSQNDFIKFYGFIDRIDELNGNIRVIDYKTGKAKNLSVSIDEKKIEDFVFDKEKVQIIQLCIYQYILQQLEEFKGRSIETGIWSFLTVNEGVKLLEFKKGGLEDVFVSIRNLILEILDPEISFLESEKVIF